MVTFLLDVIWRYFKCSIGISKAPVIDSISFTEWQKKKDEALKIEGKKFVHQKFSTEMALGNTTEQKLVKYVKWRRPSELENNRVLYESGASSGKR